MDSLIRGGDFAPCPATGCREQLALRLEQEGIEPLLRQLRQVDPEAAQRSQQNPRRVLRALEVYLETGIPISEHNRRTQLLPPRFSPVWIGLDFACRRELYDRIDQRVEQMLRLGLLQEITELLNSGVSESATSMQAIGYKEFVDALAGRVSVAEATALVQQSSRRYAKRQLTWFRRNPKINWLIREPGESGEEIFSRAGQILSNFDK